MESRDSIATRNLKTLITFISLIKMECLKTLCVYINLKNQFQIFILKKMTFKEDIWATQLAHQTLKITYHAITF